MMSSRTWFVATCLITAALAQPALAATLGDKAETSVPATPAATEPGHHGLAFAAKQGARAIIVEPDGRVIATDGRSDLIGPASIADRRAKAAIARLLSTARSEPIHDKPGES